MLHDSKIEWTLGPGVQILGADCANGRWVISASGLETARCPDCDLPSACRHGWYVRHLQDFFGGTIEPKVLRENWDELLRMGGSLETKTATPSAILKKLSGYPKQNQLARALRELGRIERTLFMIEWYSDHLLRRRCQIGLNKGEAGHKLKRAVFFHERGEVRDRSFENQAYRASGLNLAVAAIIYWNTVYLSRAVEIFRAGGHSIPDESLRHISPQTWEDAQAVFDQLQFGLLAGHDGPGIELPMAGLAFEDAVTSV